MKKNRGYGIFDGCGRKTMKKYILSVVCCIAVLALCACGKKAEPIVLPDAEDVFSVDIKIGEDTVSYSDEAWIGRLIEDFSGAEPTGEECVQDAPAVENYIKMDFQFGEGTSTLFAYEKNGKYYIEQPYQGIYRIKEETYRQLQEEK